MVIMTSRRRCFNIPETDMKGEGVTNDTTRITRSKRRCAPDPAPRGGGAFTVELAPDDVVVPVRPSCVIIVNLRKAREQYELSVHQVTRCKDSEWDLLQEIVHGRKKTRDDLTHAEKKCLADIKGRWVALKDIAWLRVLTTGTYTVMIQVEDLEALMPPKKPS